MSSWNPFSGSGVSAQTVGLENLALLEAAVRNQRAVLLRVMACMVSGQPLPLEEDPIRTFLGLPAGVSPEDALAWLQRTQARVIGKAPCPKCGAAVQDIEGVTNERCPWCGADLQAPTSCKE